MATEVHSRFDLSEIADSRVGIACTVPSILDECEMLNTTRFARVDKLTADDRGLCLQVTYDDGETETVHLSRVTYVDGKHVP